MTRPRKIVVELGTVGLALAVAFTPVEPDVIERWFSAGIYPPIQRQVTPLSNLLPFAVLDVLTIAACAAVLTALMRSVRTSWQTRQVWPVLRTFVHLTTAAALVYLAFLVLWGFNYRRLPMTERLLVQPGAPASQAVTNLGIEAATQLNALYEDAHQIGWGEAPLENETFRGAFAAAQRALSDAAPAVPGRLKRTLFGPYFRWTSVDGMVNPFGLEVLVNSDLLPYERPFVAGHEWAHLAGYADESEASFVGWLACMRADVPARYSGWLFLYWQVNGEVDAAARARLMEALGAGPRRDVEAIVERVRRGQLPWLRAAGWQVYDQYLKANRVEEGVRSYGAVVTLILRARFEPGWIPVRRASAALQAPD